MFDLGVMVTVLTGITSFIASYLYNDGHDHKPAAKVLVGLGGVGSVVAIVAGAHETRKAAEDASDCTLQRIHCPEVPDSVAGGLWDLIWPYLEQGLVTGSIMLGCGLLGLAIAKLTPRKPSDGRESDPLPE